MTMINPLKHKAFVPAMMGLAVLFGGMAVANASRDRPAPQGPTMMEFAKMCLQGDPRCLPGPARPSPFR